MPAVLELVEPTFLDRQPPRRLPLFFLPNLLGEYLLERPARSYLDPWALGAFVGTVILGMLPVTKLAAVLLFAFGLFRIITPSWVLVRRAVADYKLLRRGIIVQAHVMSLRICEDGCPQGGAYLDCVIPINARRSLVGSVWFPAAEEAQQLARLGRVQVICLPKVPGTWRLRHIDRPGIRYTPWPVVRRIEK